MILYVERQIREHPRTKLILSTFSSTPIVEIDHYKNIFDRKIVYPTEKCLILAKSDRLKLFSVPQNYGYPDVKAFFFITQLNCVFNCSYCYLKGAFKNNFPVIFVNYDDLQQELSAKILEIRDQGYMGKIVFYASNYSDLIAMEHFSSFHQSFVPFFEQFDNVLMETRTKSVNIDSLLKYGFVAKNTEVAFSLNPQKIIDAYEQGSASLKKRIEAIKKLQERGWKVGLRFLPLLPVSGYLEIYDTFLRELCQEIDIHTVNSVFLATLIYNKRDWLTMQKKESDFDLLKTMEVSDDGLVRISSVVRNEFEHLFRKYFGDKIKRDYV